MCGQLGVRLEEKQKMIIDPLALPGAYHLSAFNVSRGASLNFSLAKKKKCCRTKEFSALPRGRLELDEACKCRLNVLWPRPHRV